jgi:DNA repair protein RadC
MQVVCEKEVSYNESVRTPKAIFEILKPYASAAQEQFIVITLDGCHVPITVAITSIGTMGKTLVHMREVFVHAIRDMAAAIIVAHNHPSGGTIPSKEDEAITKRIVKSGKLLGIQVLDHLVFTVDDFFSFQMQEPELFKTNEEEI